MKVYKYLLVLAVAFVFASCSTTPSSGGGSTSSSSTSSSGSSTEDVIASLTNEVIVLCSDDASLGTPMDVDYNNSSPTTTHEVRFDPWGGGNSTAYLSDVFQSLGGERTAVIQVDVAGSSGWGGGAGFQLTNNTLTQGTNLTRFADGYIVFDVYFDANSPSFKVTIENGAYPSAITSKEILIGEGTYGEKKDGNWYTVAIPVSDFFNTTYDSSKLANVASLFQIRTLDGVSGTFYVDRIYWGR